MLSNSTNSSSSTSNSFSSTANCKKIEIKKRGKKRKFSEMEEEKRKFLHLVDMKMATILESPLEDVDEDVMVYLRTVIGMDAKFFGFQTTDRPADEEILFLALDRQLQMLEKFNTDLARYSYQFCPRLKMIYSSASKHPVIGEELRSDRHRLFVLENFRYFQVQFPTVAENSPVFIRQGSSSKRRRNVSKENAGSSSKNVSSIYDVFLKLAKKKLVHDSDAFVAATLAFMDHKEYFEALPPDERKNWVRHFRGKTPNEPTSSSTSMRRSSKNLLRNLFKNP